MRNSKGKMFLAVAMSLWLTAFTCNTQQWFQLISALLPLATQVALQFQTFASHGQISAADQAAIATYTASAKTILKDIGDAVNLVQTGGSAATGAQKAADLIKQLQGESNSLLAALQVKDTNTLAFIQAMLMDAADLAALLPVIVHPAGAARAELHASRVDAAKAADLKQTFETRLRNLPT